MQTADRIFTGLTEAEVNESRRKNGSNSLPQYKTESFLTKYIASFGDPIIKILLIALGVNILFMIKSFDIYESVGIVAAILIATLVSTVSEYGSEKAFEKLRQDSDDIRCRVIRNKVTCYIKESELVVGDIVMISAGDKVPADGRLRRGAVSCDMSALNGESREVKKFPLSEGRFGSGAELPDILMRGAVVTSGEGIMEVLAVGAATAYGRLAGELQEATRVSPLKLRLSRLASQISRIGYVTSAAVASCFIFNALVINSGFSASVISGKLCSLPYMLELIIHAVTLAVTVIVVAVPEGLPMMITVVLSSNMKRMLSDKILVKKLVGIETAGSMNILFCDKTGTLTTGEQSVSAYMLADGTKYNSRAALAENTGLYRAVMLNSVYNNEAVANKNTEKNKDKGKIIGGNATDRALMKDFAGSTLIKADILSRVPFDSAKKFSAVTIDDSGNIRTFIKGAPEYLLPGVKRVYAPDGSVNECFDAGKTGEKISELTKNAERVIAVVESCGVPQDIKKGDYTLICLICIRDKIRKDACESVRRLKGAGVSVVMLTGDNAETAKAVAAECGITGKFGEGVILTSGELALMDDSQVACILPRLSVVARALPSDKTRLVKIAQSCDYVAGMTGDGVNDAPALKIADVGFAMGSGTEVAREAGDIVMLDNNLSYIVKTVVYGRTIFCSIRKFILFQLTMNMCAVGISLIGPFIGIDTPVTVIQMLWINIIMDTLGGLAFAGEAPDENLLKDTPKKRNENLVNGGMVKQIAFVASVTVGLCTWFLKSEYVRAYFGYYTTPVYYMSAFFCLFIFLSITNSFIARTPRINLAARLSENKIFIFIMTIVTLVQLSMIYFGGSVFRAAPLSLPQLLFVSSLAVITVLFEVARRVFMRATGRR